MYSLLTNAVLSPELRVQVEGMIRDALPGCVTVVVHGGNDICSWLHVHEDVVTPRIEENAKLFGFKLDYEDVSALDRLDEGFRTSWDPTSIS